MPERTLASLMDPLVSARTIAEKERALAEIEDRRRELARRAKAALPQFTVIERADEKLKTAQAGMDNAERAFLSHLRAAYRDPTSAEAKWRELLKVDGLKGAMSAVTKRPDTLGMLNGWSFLFIRTGDRNRALVAAKALPRLGVEARIAVAMAAKAQKDMRTAREAAATDELYKIGNAARSELGYVELSLPDALNAVRREIVQMERDEFRALASRAAHIKADEGSGQLRATWIAPDDQARWRELATKRGESETTHVLKGAWRTRDPEGFAQWCGRSRSRHR